MMMSYIISASTMIGASLVFYRLFLRRETFYQANRWILVICILLSFALPLVPVPQQFSWRKTEQSVKAANPFIIPEINKTIEPNLVTDPLKVPTTKPAQEKESVWSFMDNINWTDLLVYLYITGV